MSPDLINTVATAVTSAMLVFTSVCLISAQRNMRTVRKLLDESFQREIAADQLIHDLRMQIRGLHERIALLRAAGTSTKHPGYPAPPKANPGAVSSHRIASPATRGVAVPTNPAELRELLEEIVTSPPVPAEKIIEDLTALRDELA